MNLKQNLFMILLIITLLTGFLQPCAAENTLNFCSACNIPPLSFEEDGEAKGFFVDLLREICRRAGYEATVKLYPVKRMDSYLQSGEFDGATALVHTKDRERYLFYSNTPVMVSRLSVFVRKDKKIKFKTIDDLKGKRIGVLLGYKTDSASLDKAIREGFVEIEEAAGYDQNLKKLIKGRLECLISTEQLTWYYADKLGISEEITDLELPISSHSVFFTVSKYSKNIANPHDFINKINTAFDEVVSEGAYEQLQEKYKVVSLK